MAETEARRASRRRRAAELKGFGWQSILGFNHTTVPEEVLADRDRRADLDKPALGDPLRGYGATSGQPSPYVATSPTVASRRTATLNGFRGGDGRTTDGYVRISLARVSILEHD